jgi:DNA ligase-1
MFKPQLLPNEKADLSILKYPLLASTKLDGIRCIFMNDGRILTRALKEIPNKQLIEKFNLLSIFCKNNNIILDGEIYAQGMSFQQITHYVMTDDFNSIRSVKRNKGIREEIPEELKFYCFDCIRNEDYNEPFSERIENLEFIYGRQDFGDIMELVEQVKVNSEEEVTKAFENNLKLGYEGLVLRAIDSPYKCGRVTIKEGNAYKVKPFLTFDAKILDVVQSTEAREGSKKTINELGRSRTSQKKDDRVLIDKAAGFKVMYEGKELTVVLAMTDEEKEEVWKNRKKYIGKTVEYKGMIVGSKDVPRHPCMIRMRDDK